MPSRHAKPNTKTYGKFMIYHGPKIEYVIQKRGDDVEEANATKADIETAEANLKCAQDLRRQQLHKIIRFTEISNDVEAPTKLLHKEGTRSTV